MMNDDESHEDVSYVESLFSSIPVQETIDYILQRIHVRNEIKPFCKKSIANNLRGSYSKLMVAQWETPPL